MFSVAAYLGIVYVSHTQNLYYGYVSQLWTRAEGNSPYLKAGESARAATHLWWKYKSIQKYALLFNIHCLMVSALWHYLFFGVRVQYFNIDTSNFFLNMQWLEYTFTTSTLPLNIIELLVRIYQINSILWTKGPPKISRQH